MVDFFKEIGDKLGIINLSPDEKLDLFTKKVVGELLGGKELKSDKKVDANTSFMAEYATEDDFEQIVVTDNPNQIKSATSNQGSFSNDTGDIRFQIEEENNVRFF